MKASGSAGPVAVVGTPDCARKSGDDAAGRHPADEVVLRISHVKVSVGPDRDSVWLVEERASPGAVEEARVSG